MNKSELRGLWGHYADTDKLVDDIASLLTEYHHRNSEHGICTMLNSFFTNKKPLIDMMQRSEHYAGNLRIIKCKEFARDNNAAAIARFCGKFTQELKADKEILKRSDASGKTVEDYIKTGVKSFDVKKLHDASFLKERVSPRTKFDNEGYTIESANQYKKLSQCIYDFSSITSGTLSESQARNLSPYIKVAKGMKTSRAFNRACEQMGVAKLQGYNKLFAQYADMVSDLTRHLDYVISVNPYDYLTMSFGESWASCHTIDKTNRRGMQNHYSGGYCGGTLSYMLDKTSIISFVVRKDSDVQSEGKIYRNMFHFYRNTLIQGRVYPQGNDGNVDLYEKFRDFMHEEIASILGTENNWHIQIGKNECYTWTRSCGVHYRDYTSFNSCNVSYLTASATSPRTVEIGSEGICPYCGERFSMSGYLSHSDCSI